jgi:hypothetical protein
MTLIRIAIIIALSLASPAWAKKDKPTKLSSPAWSTLSHDGTCAPLSSLKHKFPAMPPIHTPQELEQYLKSHQGRPRLYPIDDPNIPISKGYTLIDEDHQLSLMLLPSKECENRFQPQKMGDPSTQPRPPF